MNSNYQLQLTKDLQVELPLIDLPNGVSFYSFDLLGKASWNRILAVDLTTQLRMRLSNMQKVVLLTVEAKAIALTEHIAEHLNIDTYIVIRKSCKSYMRHPISFQGSSITSGLNYYWIDHDDVEKLKNNDVIICDDVISSGGTLASLLKIVSYAHGRTVAIACAVCEGVMRDEYQGIPLVSCAYLPFPKSMNTGVNND